MRNKELWIALGIGALAGGVAALLYAPQTGSKTRKQLKRGLVDAGDALEQAGDYLKDQAERLSKEAQRLIETGKGHFDDAVDAAGDYAKTASGYAQTASEFAKGAGDVYAKTVKDASKAARKLV